ncbi:nucleoside diphosphate kinase [Cutibacterium acnes JCM 18918]|nr:nucleoside diphosphate kinase [Cutibacterium acnes JCM 18918]
MLGLMSDEERTLVLLKPDAVKRRLMGEIIGRYEAKGLTVRAMELSTIDTKIARKHYAEHVAGTITRRWRSSLPRVRSSPWCLKGAGLSRLSVL